MKPFAILLGSFLSMIMTFHSARAQNAVYLGVSRSLTDAQADLASRSHYKRDTAIQRQIDEKLATLNHLLPTLITCASNWPDNGPENNNHPLIREMDNYKDLFELIATTKSFDSVNAILGFILEDMNLKIDNRLGSVTAAAPMVAVQVKVLSEAEGKELPGYITHVKPQWAVSPLQEDVFNPTTNAIMNLEPGDKFFWIIKDGQVIQNKVAKICSTDASNNTVEFIVKVPSQTR